MLLLLVTLIELMRAREDSTNAIAPGIFVEVGGLGRHMLHVHHDLKILHQHSSHPSLAPPLYFNSTTLQL